MFQRRYTTEFELVSINLEVYTYFSSTIEYFPFRREISSLESGFFLCLVLDAFQLELVYVFPEKLV